MKPGNELLKVLVCAGLTLLWCAPASAEVKKVYHDTGKVHYEWNYVNGMLEGVSKEYYKQGPLKFEWSYKSGRLDGIARRYYKSGKLMEELNYKNGEKDGRSRGYYENGRIHFVETYKNGDLVDRVEYDEEDELTPQVPDNGMNPL